MKISLNPLKSGRVCNESLRDAKNAVDTVSIPLNRVGFVMTENNIQSLKPKVSIPLNRVGFVINFVLTQDSRTYVSIPLNRVGFVILKEIL